MSWTAIAKCLGGSAKTLSRRRQEYGITDYTEIREDELEWNVRDILQLTSFSGETYIQGALRASFTFSSGKSEMLCKKLTLLIVQLDAAMQLEGASIMSTRGSRIVSRAVATRALPRIMNVV